MKSRENSADVARALGEAVDESIANWVEGGAVDRAGQATFFEHPAWGTFVVLVEPSTRMTIASLRSAQRKHEAEKAARAAHDAPEPVTIELPPPEELRELLREGMQDPATKSMPMEARHLHALGHMRQALARRMSGRGGGG